MLREGPRTARLHAEVDNRWAPIHYTLGHTFPGLSSDFIIAGGHQDSWIGPAAHQRHGQCTVARIGLEVSRPNAETFVAA